MSQERWHAIWTSRGTLAVLLWPASRLYMGLVAVRRWLYATGLLRQECLPVPVVVVGNVVVGGAGKTPTVIALIEHLKASGWHPGVISRGYGRSGDSVREVHDDTPASESGDEPALIRRRTGVPVFVAPRRADAGRALLATHRQVDILLCDDGLQHWALKRDIALAVFDERNIGNGWCLPAGLLREPWPPAACHPYPPNLTLTQRTGKAAGTALAHPINLPAFVAVRRLSNHALGPKGQRQILSDLRERPLTALAGIARPVAFFDMLSRSGLHISRQLPMDDHAPASAYEALDLSAGETILCTEKDAVKLFPVLPLGVEAWAIPLEIEPEPAFWAAFDELLTRRTHRD